MRALEIREKVHGPDHPAVAVALNNRRAYFLEEQVNAQVVCDISVDFIRYCSSERFLYIYSVQYIWDPHHLFLEPGQRFKTSLCANPIPA